jgi:hypothetical protein
VKRRIRYVTYNKDRTIKAINAKGGGRQGMDAQEELDRYIVCMSEAIKEALSPYVLPELLTLDYPLSPDYIRGRMAAFDS